MPPTTRGASLAFDGQGRLLDCASAACRLLGRRRREIELGGFDSLDARGTGGLFESILSRLQNGEPVSEEAALRDDEGRLRRVWLIARLVPRRGGPVVEITVESLEAHEAAQPVHGRYGSGVASTSDYVFAKDLEGRYVEANQALLAALGREAADVIGRRDEDLFPETVALEHTARDHIVELSGHTLEDETTVELNGVRRMLVVRRSPWRNADGETVGVIGVATDITGFKEKERRRDALVRELGEANARLQRVLGEQTRLGRRAGALLDAGRELGSELESSRIHHMAVHTVERSLDGAASVYMTFEPERRCWTLRAFGPAGTALVDGPQRFDLADADFSDDALAGRLFVRHRVDGARNAFEQALSRAGLKAYSAMPVPGTDVTRGVLVAAWGAWRAPMPEELWFLEHLALQVGAALRNAGLYEDLQRTVRALRQAEARASQESRLRAVGELAAGVAHDFNNSLTTILGLTEWLLYELPPDAPVRGDLQTIRTAADDAASMVRRLQLFGRQAPDANAAPVDLAEIARTVPDLARPRCDELSVDGGRSFEIAVHAPAPLVVRGVAAELRELLVNLVLNALDAMPGGGQIRIEMGTRSGRPEIAVHDSGVGMTEEVKARVFEPFFTTKTGHGNGLGLSVCWSIAERHGATIEVETALGAGSTFRLSFAPDAVLDAGLPAAAAPPDRNEAVGSLAVLLVDDQVDVCDSLAEMIGALGHRVTKANDGATAVAQLAQGPFDLVITDLGMPGMNGIEVARHARAAGVPVMLLTGWGVEYGTHPPEGIRLVVTKPLTMRALRDGLAQVLGERAIEARGA